MGVWSYYFRDSKQEPQEGYFVVPDDSDKTNIARRIQVIVAGLHKQHCQFLYAKPSKSNNADEVAINNRLAKLKRRVQPLVLRSTVVSYRYRYRLFVLLFLVLVFLLFLWRLYM